MFPGTNIYIQKAEAAVKKRKRGKKIIKRKKMVTRDGLGTSKLAASDYPIAAYPVQFNDYEFPDIFRISGSTRLFSFSQKHF